MLQQVNIDEFFTKPTKVKQQLNYNVNNKIINNT